MFDIAPAEWTAILLSLRVAVVATLVATPFGIALAWLLARREFWGKSILDAAVHLPLVLPPVVTGYLLLLTFGRRGLVGAWLADHLGVVFAFRARYDCRSRRSTAGWSRRRARLAPRRGRCSPP
jgi:molybdate transport system permease protein